MLDALGIGKAHVHGTSMGGMVATVMAGKYPDRIQSVVINCAAAKLGFSGQLVFRNWIDLIRLEGVGSRTLAELISWQCLSKAYMETPEGQAGVDTIQQILRDSNEPRVMIAACEGMNAMDNREWVKKITSPALVVGGDEDVMTPWDQGPKGAGQQWIADNLPNGETYVVKGSNHSTIFDNSEEHARAVADFFRRHPGAA
jgi:pimeloyl-ACP methyl ester carboxylesterase